MSLVKRISLAKELSEIKEIEVGHFVSRLRDCAYKNYLRTDTAELKPSGGESLKTVLQALYKLNGYTAKYIIGISMSLKGLIMLYSISKIRNLK
jgi:hypothetical protein